MKMRFEDICDGGMVEIKVNKYTSIEVPVDDTMLIRHTTGTYWATKVEFIEE